MFELKVITNPCSSTPCQNGGTCSSNSLGTQYSCICPDGTSGLNCQTGIFKTINNKLYNKIAKLTGFIFYFVCLSSNIEQL